MIFRSIGVSLIVLLTLGNPAEGADPDKKPARVSGKILFEGAVLPETAKLKTNENIDYCGETVPSDRLLIDRNSKGIKNAVVLLSPRQEESHPSSKKGEAIHALLNFHCRFAPHVLVMKKGESLFIKNGDPLLHSNHLYKGTKSLFNLAVTPGSEPIQKAINEERELRLKCDIHDFMEAFILVDPAPWSLITDDKGAFNFGEVPPGPYRFSVWHETFDRLVVDLTLKPGEERYLPLGVKPN